MMTLRMHLMHLRGLHGDKDHPFAVLVGMTKESVQPGHRVEVAADWDGSFRSWKAHGGPAEQEDQAEGGHA